GEMTIIASAPPTRVEPHVDSAHSFLVTRRDRGTGRYERLGVLTQVQDGWDFRYFREVAERARARALPGIPVTGSVRHRSAAEQTAVDALADEDGLLLVAEPDNPVDPEALLVTTVGGTALGWVPAPLLPLLDHGTAGRGGPLLAASPANAPAAAARLVPAVGGTALGWVPAPLLPLRGLGADARASGGPGTGSGWPPRRGLSVELRVALLRRGVL